MDTTATTATRSIVTALGGGSGIDMTALANDLAVAQFAARAERLSSRSQALEQRISAAANLKSMMQNLASSLGDRLRTGDLAAKPALANPAVAQAALSGTRTPSGTYALEVTRLASAQVIAGPAYASAAAPVGSGSLTLRFGTIALGVFSEDAAHPAVPIAIASGATLNDVAAAINGAQAGVSAYVAQTTEGAKLVLKGQEGATNAFVLDASETAGEEGLAALAWSPAAAPERLLNSAGDAAFRVDGLSLSAASNTATDAIPGVTLRFTATNAGAPTTVSFADPAAAIASAMADLTGALNEIAGELRSATDPQTGELRADPGAAALRRALSGLAGTAIMPDGAVRTLADLGLATQRDGGFALDNQRLTAALRADPQAVAAMFTTGISGVYATIDGLARRAASAGDPGTLAGSISRYTAQRGRITQDQTKLAEAQETMRARLVSRFAVSEARVGASRSTLSFLQNQIDAWNAQRA